MDLFDSAHRRFLACNAGIQAGLKVAGQAANCSASFLSKANINSIVEKLTGAALGSCKDIKATCRKSTSSTGASTITTSKKRTSTRRKNSKRKSKPKPKPSVVNADNPIQDGVSSILGNGSPLSGVTGILGSATNSKSKPGGNVGNALGGLGNIGNGIGSILGGGNSGGTGGLGSIIGGATSQASSIFSGLTGNGGGGSNSPISSVIGGATSQASSILNGLTGNGNGLSSVLGGVMGNKREKSGSLFGGGSGIPIPSF